MSQLRPYPISLIVGFGIGVIYRLIDGQSPAPLVNALFGPLGIRAGEAGIPRMAAELGALRHLRCPHGNRARAFGRLRHECELRIYHRAQGVRTRDPPPNDRARTGLLIGLTSQPASADQAADSALMQPATERSSAASALELSLARSC